MSVGALTKIAHEHVHKSHVHSNMFMWNFCKGGWMGGRMNRWINGWDIEWTVERHDLCFN